MVCLIGHGFQRDGDGCVRLGVVLQHGATSDHGAVLVFRDCGVCAQLQRWYLCRLCVVLYMHKFVETFWRNRVETYHTPLRIK